MDYNEIMYEINKILLKRAKINFAKRYELMNEKLLGPYIGLPYRELVHIYFDIEKVFQIKIPESEIANGNFDSLNNIVNVISKQLV